MPDLTPTVIDVVIFTAQVLIAFYATHQAALLLMRACKDSTEVVSGLGGLLYLIGVYFYDNKSMWSWSLALGLAGISLMFWPRIVRIVQSAVDCDGDCR